MCYDEHRRDNHTGLYAKLKHLNAEVRMGIRRNNRNEREMGMVWGHWKKGRIEKEWSENSEKQGQLGPRSGV